MAVDRCGLSKMSTPIANAAHTSDLTLKLQGTFRLSQYMHPPEDKRTELH